MLAWSNAVKLDCIILGPNGVGSEPQPQILFARINDINSALVKIILSGYLPPFLGNPAFLEILEKVKILESSDFLPDYDVLFPKVLESSGLLLPSEKGEKTITISSLEG